MENLNEVNANVSSDAIENPIFLLSLRICGKNLHNCLIDLRASRNIIPYSICRKLGLQPVRANRKVVQLDKIEINVIGELKDVYIQLGVDPQISCYIDIQVVDILEVYGILLSRDWSKTLGGYFSTYFTYLWLPWKGISNQIRIDSEPKLSKLVTDYSAPNEVVFAEVSPRVYRVNEILTFSSLTPL